MQPTVTDSTTRRVVGLDDLRGVATAVAEAIEGAVHVTLVVVRQGMPWVAVSTAPAAEALDAVERTCGGPAVDALWSGRIARISSTMRDTHWPEYSRECQRQGIGSVAAFPIEVDGVRRGVLIVTSAHYFGFAAEETRIGINATIEAAHRLEAQSEA
jgi:GAF domain-containing protein